MKKWISTLTGVMIFIPIFSNGISRIGNGNGRMDVESVGYSLELPKTFKFQIIKPESVRFVRVEPLKNNSASIYFPFNKSVIELYPIKEYFDDYTQLNREEFSKKLQKDGYETITTSDSCIVAGINKSDSAYYALVRWGVDNSGYTLFGTKENKTNETIIEMVKSTKLIEGHCQWR